MKTNTICKKALSLLLALTLALTLLPMTALSLSGTAYDYADSGSDPINPIYLDAVDLLHELGIMTGFTDGSYKPSAGLTRAQYIKMLYVVFNRGVDDKGVYYTGISPFPFTDVPASEWYQGYVKWAFSRGYISGGSSGTQFFPNNNISGFEALKLSLCALGYDQNTGGYTGGGWLANVLNDAQDAGLLNGLAAIDLTQPMSREAAAQLLYNTLFATMIRYDTAYVPPRIEKVDTMAYTYFGLRKITAVLVANEWAAADTGAKSLAGESRYIFRTVDNESVRETTGLTFKCAAPLELLGKELTILAKETLKPANSNNVGTYDANKLYGKVKETPGRNDVTTFFAENKIIKASVNDTKASDTLGWFFDADRLKDTNMNRVKNATVICDYNEPMTFADYNNGANISKYPIEQGAQVDFLDNNKDGNFEYIIIRNLTYAKVTDVEATGAVTAVAGDITDLDFTGKQVLSAKAAADIYCTKAGNIYERQSPEADDRVLLYPIDGKFGAILIEPTAGTFTGARSNGAIAVISGKDYKSSPLLSAVSTPQSITVAANLNVEYGYYFYHGYLLEGDEGYTVKFDLNYTGAPAGPATQTVADGGYASKPTPNPTRSGYTFGGWHKEAACKNAWNFASDTVTADMTLYARWTTSGGVSDGGGGSNKYTVTFNLNGASGTAPSAQSIVSGGMAATPAAPTWAGYTFSGWYKEASCTNAWNFASDKVTNNITLYAKWLASGTLTASMIDPASTGATLVVSNSSGSHIPNGSYALKNASMLTAMLTAKTAASDADKLEFTLGAGCVDLITASGGMTLAGNFSQAKSDGSATSVWLSVEGLSGTQSFTVTGSVGNCVITAGTGNSYADNVTLAVSGTITGAELNTDFTGTNTFVISSGGVVGDAIYLGSDATVDVSAMTHADTGFSVYLTTSTVVSVVTTNVADITSASYTLTMAAAPGVQAVAPGGGAGMVGIRLLGSGDAALNCNVAGTLAIYHTLFLTMQVNIEQPAS